jgi:ESCRT-II complex subunit VPS36
MQQQQHGQPNLGCWFLSVAAFPIGDICTKGRALTVTLPNQHNRLRQVPSDESLLLPPHPLLPPQGFPRPRVLRALLATHSEHMQAALDWILAARSDPSMDAPFTGPEPSQVSRQELQQLQQLATMRQQQQQQQGLMPGWGMGSVAAAAGAAGVSGAQVQSGMWPAAAGPYAGSGGGAAGSSSVLNSSGSGPAGAYSNTVSGSQQQQQVSVGSSRVVGIAGIMHREAEKSSQTSASLAVAFRDLDNLMDMAADMVKLAEKFRGVMGPDGSILLNNNNNTVSNNNTNSNTESAAAGGSGEQLLLDADTQLQLIAMGIASPVTRASAGARYHQELSRQLADFLAGPLARAGGVLMLPDVYCLFNRARGSELVSPDDLLQACEAFPQVRGARAGWVTLHVFC